MASSLTNQEKHIVLGRRTERRKKKKIKSAAESYKVLVPQNSRAPPQAATRGRLVRAVETRLSGTLLRVATFQGGVWGVTKGRGIPLSVGKRWWEKRSVGRRH